jgi:hypothetical protein
VAFQRDELERLGLLAQEEWAVAGHVIPYEVANETMHQSIRQSALGYFKRHDIKWWTSRYDKRAKDEPSRPTGHLNSSQVACVNHLEPARIDAAVATKVIANVEPNLAAVPVDDGFLDYEWIGADSYLGEKGPRTRGAHVTSLDALMCGAHDGGGR